MKAEVFTGKNLEEIKSEAFEKLGLNENECLVSVKTTKSGLFKTKEEFQVSVYKLTDIAEEIKNYLSELLTNMSIEANFETKIREQQINIKMYSDKNNILIGKDGKTLKALQTVIRQHIYKEIGAYPYILLDVENYKEKNEERLVRSAKKIAKEVAKTKVEAELENMNSYQRRLIHNALTDFKGVYTESVGEEPNRHIVIKPKES